MARTAQEMARVFRIREAARKERLADEARDRMKGRASSSDTSPMGFWPLAYS